MKPTIEAIKARQWALFLDVDGTLLEFADHPEQVTVPDTLTAVLSQLHRELKGALALVSGRGISQLDRLFQPLQLASAGFHGSEIRDPNGQLHNFHTSDEALDIVKLKARSFVDQHPGMVFEDKGAAIALHYRQVPELETEVQAVADQLCKTLSEDYQALAGKMVVELKPAHRHKGHAIESLLQHPPFFGKTPVYLGDDVTDEDAFREVNRLGGLSIKVGEGDSLAAYRLQHPADVLAWLQQLATTLTQGL